MLSNNNSKKTSKNFAGLRPLEPSKAPAFWDAINFKIGLGEKTYAFEDKYNEDELDELKYFKDLSENSEYFFENDTVIHPAKKVRFDNISCEELKEEQQLEKSTLFPYSFPKPDPSCFVQYYAPLEPWILLPNHFTIYSDSLEKTSTLEKISTTLENYLKTRNDIIFSATGSSWSGNIVNCFCHTSFRLCIYKSKKEDKIYIIEAQRIEGDGFVFGNFYQDIKRLFKN